MNFEILPNGTRLLVVSNKEMTLYGDMEVLLLLKMHQARGQKGVEEVVDRHFPKDKNVLLDILEEEFSRVDQKNS